MDDQRNKQADWVDKLLKILSELFLSAAAFGAFLLFLYVVARTLEIV